MLILRSLVATMMFCSVTALANPAAIANASTSVLVREGQATSMMVLPDDAPATLEQLCRQWVARVEKSTGARIPIYRESEAPEATDDVVQIHVGATRQALEAGIDATSLPEETFGVRYRKGAIYLLGAEPLPHPDVPKPPAPSAPLRWALNHLQEEGLGVRFLWPGELGTWVPRHQNFELKGEDTSYRPPLALRVLRMSRAAANPARDQIYAEGLEWAQNHYAGRRDSFFFGHAFTHWWKAYSKDHPDLFAQPPEGVDSPIAQSKPEFVKLRLSNPKTVEFIAKEYQAAGAPKYWNVCPNDGSGFDLSPGTLAWDDPKGQDPAEIWKGSDRSNLTARHVHFWNRVSRRLREINPEATLVTYAYWSYRYAPKPDQPLHHPTVVGIVDGWDAFETWKGWRQAGAELSLRPNWGYYSAGAPVVWAREIAEFMRFTHQHGMIGFDLDQIIGHWATEGLNLYVMARMMNHPELTAEEIVSEYCEAFGAAAPKVRAYFDYWQERGTEFGYPIPAGGTTGPNRGKFRQLVEQGAISDNYYHAPYAALPLLYTDEVLAPASALLEEARAMVEEGSEAFERVEFLRAGLHHHWLMREAMALGLRLLQGEKEKALFGQFESAAKALDTFRQSTPFPHLAWDAVAGIENRFKAPIRPANLKAEMVDTITIE